MALFDTFSCSFLLVIDWKDWSPKCVPGDIKPYSLTHSHTLPIYLKDVASVFFYNLKQLETMFIIFPAHNIL